MATYYLDEKGQLTKKKKGKTYTLDEKGKLVEDDSWLQAGAMSDGFSMENLGKAAVGTLVDVGQGLLSGLAGMGEQALDSLLTVAPYVAQGQYYQNGGAYQAPAMQKAQEEMFANAKAGNAEIVENDLYDEEKVANAILRGVGVSSSYIENQMEEDSVFGSKVDSLVQSGGQLLGTAALSTMGVPWFLTTGITSFGGETESALSKGATLDEAAVSGLVAAGAEILTEQISGGIKFGGKTLDDALTKQLSRAISNKTVSTLAKLGVDIAGEGTEEVLSGILGAVGQKLTYADDKELSELFSKESAMDSFIGGAILGGISGTGKLISETAKGVVDQENIAPISQEKIKENYSQSEDKSFYQFIVDAIAGKLPKKSFHKISQKISDRMAKDIEKIVGFSVKEYGNEISPSSIRHINKEHGANGRSDRSMKDYHDLARLSYVINNYDNIREGKISEEYRNSDGSFAKTVELQKKIDDGFYYVVEAVPDAKNKTLHVVSAYINKKDTFSDVLVSNDPKRYVQDEHQPNASSNNIISQIEENATNKSLGNKFEGLGPLPEEVAPVQQTASTLEDIAPVRQDVNYTPEQPDYPTKPIETVKERNAAKLQNYKVELQNIETFREAAHQSYNKQIAELQAKYDAKQNKATKAANELLQSIERQKRLRDNTDATYEKRISDLKSKIDKMSTKEFKTAEQRQTKQEEYRTQMGELMGDTSTWKDKKLGISYKVNTLRRNLRDIVRNADGSRDIAKADAIYDELQGTYNRNEARLNREANVIKEKFRKLKITAAEDKYIQMLGEYKDNPDTTILADQLKEFYEANKDKIDAEKVDNIIKDARKLYDDLFQRVNEVLREQGMKEIEYRKGYFPHFSEEAQPWWAKALNWKVKNNEIPTDLAGLTEQFNPDRSWQSFNKHRTGDNTSYSFTKGLDMYVNGALDWIYHIPDIQKRRAFENEIRYRHSEQGRKDRVDALRNNEEYSAEEMQEQLDIIYEEASNPLNNFVTDFRTQTNTLAGKKSSMDRGMEEYTNRKFYSTMTNASNRVTANMVAGSISSALTNFIPITQSWGMVSPKSSLRAMGDTLRSVFRDDGIVDKSDFLTNRLRKNENLNKTNWDKASEKAGILMDAIDSFTSQTVWRSKYLENISSGMSESEAIKNADQFTENIMAGRSRGSQPTIFDAKNPLIKIFTAFQLEVSNQYGYMFKDMPQDVKDKSLANLVKGYATMFIGAYAYNALYSSITGRDAAFDPIGILEELLRNMGWIGDDEEEPVDAMMNLTDNILDEVPYVGGLAGGGRIPISSALPYGEGLYETLTGTLDDIENKDMANLTKEWMNPVYYLLMPFGGGQIKKTIQGLKMFDDDFPTAGSYTDSGNLRFPVEDTVGNRIKAGIFGQYASENARDYFDNNRSPLKEKQIQEYIDLDLPIRDYWEYRENMPDGTLDEKFDYIAGLPISVEQKNIMINNIVDREEPVDMTNYDEFENYEEFDWYVKNVEKYKFLQANGISYSEYKANEDNKKLYDAAYQWAKDDPERSSFLSEKYGVYAVDYKRMDEDGQEAYTWAYKNPEKRTVSEAVTEDVVQYRKWTSELNGIRADKDAKGNSINGSAKKKKVAYINNLKLDYGQRIILFRSIYKEDDTYNADIVEYLNGRKDISYNEMVTILVELGFSVMPDGTVKW